MSETTTGGRLGHQNVPVSELAPQQLGSWSPVPRVAAGLSVALVIAREPGYGRD